MNKHVINALTLGDMLVLGSPQPKLIKSLAVIADVLGPEYGKEPSIEVRSKPPYPSVLASLIVSEFLRSIGFVAARVRPVCTVIRAEQHGEELHSLAIGHPEDEGAGRAKWGGHMVTVVDRFVIDVTLHSSLTLAVAAVAWNDDVTVVRWGD